MVSDMLVACQYIQSNGTNKWIATEHSICVCVHFRVAKGDTKQRITDEIAFWELRTDALALHRRLLPADGELALGHAQPIDYIIGHKLDANREREREKDRKRANGRDAV